MRTQWFHTLLLTFTLIEHLWSPLSKKLSSVRLNAVDEDDQHSPWHLSGLTDTERSEKKQECSIRQSVICVKDTGKMQLLESQTSEGVMHS